VRALRISKLPLESHKNISDGSVTRNEIEEPKTRTQTNVYANSVCVADRTVI